MKLLMRHVAVFVLLVGSACTRSESRGNAQQEHAASDASKSKVFLETIRSVPASALRASGPGIERTQSGVATRVIKRGDGMRHPTSDDGVILYSQVYNEQGRVIGRWDGFVGDPVRDLNRTGFETIQMMVTGEVRRVWFPDATSPGGARITDYELVWITPRPKEETALKGRRWSSFKPFHQNASS